MAKPAALRWRDHEKGEKPKERQRTDVFRQAGHAESQSDEEPEPPDAALALTRIEQEAPERADRQREGEQERAIRHNPSPGGSEEEGRRVKSEQCDEPGSRPEQLRRQPKKEPARRREQRDEGKPRTDPLPERKRCKMRDPLVERWMVEIGQAEIARDRERIGFVDAKPEGDGEDEPSGEKSYEDSRCEPVSGVKHRRFIPRRSDGLKLMVSAGACGCLI